MKDLRLCKKFCEPAIALLAVVVLTALTCVYFYELYSFPFQAFNNMRYEVQPWQ